jgi:macrolide transport system ATP-binding/permease protein
MFALQHIHKSFDDKIVLNDINFAVNSGEVTALIGENGTGKTTLLKVIMGENQPDSGSVALHYETIGYVPQEADVGKTIQDAFDANVEPWRIDYALGLVGLGTMKGSLSVKTLSGGQKTRLALAGVLAHDPEPTVLLLDEPTNNLDAEGLVWLADFIRSFRGGIVLVSHDRHFINQVATDIAELRNGELRHYGGNYDFYIEQRAIERETEVQRYEQHIAEKKQLEQSISDQREKGQHTHKHIKRNDNDKYQRDFFRNRVTVKFGQQARALETRLNQLGDVERPENIRNYGVTLNGATSSEKLLLRLSDVGKSYDRDVLSDIGLELRGNERVHISGHNGSGKTTLLKIAAGLLKPNSGERILGNNVRIGYFSQDVDSLDYERSALENLQSTDATPTDIFREARSLGLDKQTLQKLPGQLSRGQQAKLGFAKLLLSSYHLLVLDEPTNHLDIPTREQIEAALQAYNGALLFASHDRYFVETMRPTKTMQITNGRLQ